MAGRKNDFTLPTLDDLFSTQEMRDDAKLAKIRDIPLELIDDFPDHPFKVRDDEDMIPDYVGDLLYTIDNSFLEDLNEDMIASLYRKTVTNSVAYMMMERLGIDTEEHFFREDFEDIVNFNTPETLNALGFATSDIAEMGLAEIAKTVMSLEKQNRIIAENQNSDYNKVKENQTERSLENDRTDLHDAGRLQTAQSDLTGAAGSTDGKIRSTESEVPEGKSQGCLWWFGCR